MISASCFLFSASVLFFVLKYRVHIHVTYAPRIDRRAVRDLRWPRPAVSSHGDHQDTMARVARMGKKPVAESPIGRSAPLAIATAAHSDIVSALVNLGCSKSEAREAAKRAVEQGPAEFESLLRRAIQEAA